MWPYVYQKAAKLLSGENSIVNKGLENGMCWLVVKKLATEVLALMLGLSQQRGPAASMLQSLPEQHRVPLDSQVQRRPPLKMCGANYLQSSTT